VFFVLSKTIGFLLVPTNLIIALGLLGALLYCTRIARLGARLMLASIILLAIAGFSPLGNALLWPLENRFPAWNPARGGSPDGIIVLGGTISAEIVRTRGTLGLDEAAERFVASLQLANRYPKARIVFAGGNADLLVRGGDEASVAIHEYEEFGVAPNRLFAERRSRDTFENVLFSRQVANYRPGERWLLVTSAAHMPRAIATFRAVGFPVEAYPVDYQTTGLPEDFLPSTMPSRGLQLTDAAAHEWIGLLAYRVSGRTSELFPKP
jgi:uncharacterized SAM-binding protein YcdF (DUF218 family)